MDASKLPEGDEDQVPLSLWGIISGDKKHEFRFVRELSPQEQRDLADAHELIHRFAGGSPLEALAKCAERFQEACAHQGRLPSEGGFARIVICVKEFDAATSEFLAFHGHTRGPSGTPPGPFKAPSDADSKDRSAAYDDLLRLKAMLSGLPTEDFSQWALTPSGLECRAVDQVVLVGSILGHIVRRAEELLLSMVNELSGELDSACLLIRLLAAEVLQGSPAVMPRTSDFKTITPRPLEMQEAAYVQELRRIAATANPTHREDRASRDAPRDQPSIPSRRSVPQDAPEQADASSAIPTPEPPIDELVGQLSAGLEDFLTAWSKALDRADLLENQESLRGAVGAISRACLREFEADEDAQKELRLGYPLDIRSIAALDLTSNDHLLSLSGLGRVMLVKKLVQSIEWVASIRTLEVRGDQVLRLSHHPGAIEHAMYLATALSTCVREAQRPTADQWLILARQAYAAGMAEASILYSMFALGADGSDHPVRHLGVRLLELGGGADTAPNRACYVPIAEAMLTRWEHDRTKND